LYRNYKKLYRKDIKPVEVMCWADTQVKPIEAEDHAIGLIKYENGAISQFEVSWTFRGGMDLRDEVMGTEGTIWINNFLRTGWRSSLQVKAQIMWQKKQKAIPDGYSSRR
jgi:predicted dehydrogenase